MNEDITLNPERTNRGMQQLQRGQMVREPDYAGQTSQAMQMRAASGVACPHCGALNDPDAMYCASCGQAMGMTTCPNCGAELDADADFCESCHHYIRRDVCSFCGARLMGEEAYCPECGSPRGGIVCPTCHTLNEFSFCKQCGTPLTDEARMLMEQMQMTPEYQEMERLAAELQKIEMTIPLSSERDMLRNQVNEKLRERILNMLAQDRNEERRDRSRVKPAPVTKEQLREKKEDFVNRLSELLMQMAQQPQVQPAKVRNYAMACKPQGVRLAWECNYKHALHSSPCGCAKPQMGGMWVVLGRNTRKEIKDDK